MVCGIQGPIALPGDSIFSKPDNKYDIPSTEELVMSLESLIVLILGSEMVIIID